MLGYTSIGRKMGRRLTALRQAIRKRASLPMSEWALETPRLLARGVYFGLPLWLTYSKTATVTADGASVTGLLYSYRWPFWLLVACYAIVGIYKLASDPEDASLLAQRRILARSTAGALKQLQELVLGCPDGDALDTVQQGILSIIVDKTKELLADRRDGVISANLMIADEANQKLHLRRFSRHATGRKKIDVAYGAPGAGRAIVEGRPVVIADIRSADLKAHFRDDAPYRSILSIPVACEHRRLGVVNVDSTDKGYFPVDTWLSDHLEPYVQLVGLSLCLGKGSDHAERH